MSLIYLKYKKSFFAIIIIFIFQERLFTYSLL